MTPAGVVVETSFAPAVIPTKVVPCGVVVLGKRGRREDQRGKYHRHHQHQGSTHLLPLCASVAQLFEANIAAASRGYRADKTRLQKGNGPTPKVHSLAPGRCVLLREMYGMGALL